MNITELPTKEQDVKMTELKEKGYYWDKRMSIASAGVMLRKGIDIWFFGLDGEIMHSPEGITISL